jgi:TPR repeat protein
LKNNKITESYLMKKVISKKILVLFAGLLFIYANTPVYSQANFPDQSLLKKAQAGDIQAQVEVGKIYRSGAKGLPVDYFTAYDWFHKAELKNNAEAFYQIGSMHHSGQIGPLELYTGMFDNSDYSGFQGGHPGANINYSKALTWYMKAADLNHAGAQYAIATIHAMEWQNGRRGRPNFEEALTYYRKAADNGNGNAVIDLYEIYQYGWSAGGYTLVKSDKNEAAKWYARALNHEDPQTIYLLAVDLFFSGNKKQKEEAVRLFRKAAEQNIAWAMYYLGKAYEHGDGVKSDRSESAKWYRSAAENGSPELQFLVGEEFEDGILGAKGRDVDEALKWYRTAGENGNAMVAYKVGAKFFEGWVGIESVKVMEARLKSKTYIKRDNAEAFKWYYKAATEGRTMVTPINHFPYDNLWFINANQVLQAFYSEGKIVPKDEKAAEKWGFTITFPPDLKNNERNAFLIASFLRRAKEIAEEWNARWRQIIPQ